MAEVCVTEGERPEVHTASFCQHGKNTTTTTTTMTKPFSWIGSKQPWLKWQTGWNISEKHVQRCREEHFGSIDIYIFQVWRSSGSGGGVNSGRSWLTAGRRREKASALFFFLLPFCLEFARLARERVLTGFFTFNMTGAGCATLPSKTRRLCGILTVEETSENPGQ